LHRFLDSYVAPAGTLQIVFGGPVGDMGRSEVTATKVGDDCEVSITAADGEAGFTGLPLIFVANSDCELSEDGDAPDFDVEEPEMESSDGGCGCDSSDGQGASLVLLILLTTLGMRRRRRA